MFSRVACMSCGGEMEPWLKMAIDAKKDEPTPFSSVKRCSACGLGSLSPLPDEEDIPGFYELDRYYTHGESHIQAVPPNILDRLLTKLAWAADRSRYFEVCEVAQSLPPDAKICDLGCGDAQYLQTFKALGFDVLGVEPDPSSRERANAAGVTVLNGTAESPPLNEQFDLVIMTHALEHCRDPRRAMQNAYELTKRAGRCYIEVPNCAAEHFRTFTVCSEMFDAPRHIHFFSPDNLAALAESAGFRVINRLFNGYVRDFGPGWRAWESDIARRIGAKPHSWLASLSLFLRSFWRSPERKYDCVGLLLQRP